MPLRLCYVRPVQVLDISDSSILGDIIIVSMIDLQMVQKKNSIAIINVVVVGVNNLLMFVKQEFPDQAFLPCWYGKK